MTDSLDRLRAIVGAANVLTDDDAAPLLRDWRGVFQGEALGVVRPGTTEEVAAVMAWCHEHSVIVVTQGGNTGLSGAATPIDLPQAIVLSLMRLNQIEEVDTEGWTMTVQAGVTIEAMHDAAAAQDRLFAPDWGARGTATIGGAIATDAGGNNVVRYGNMRDQIMGIEAVLADGRIWNGLRALRKDSSGYDLKQLFIGSEGTLGIITRAIVKLHPATAHEQSALASLTSLDELMAVFSLAREMAPDAVLAFELMPEVAVAKACEVFDITHPMEKRSDFYVLVKFASAQPVTDLLSDFLAAAEEGGMVGDAVIAGTAEQERRLWKIREEIPAVCIYEHHGVGLKMDSAVPINRIGDYNDVVHAIAAELTPDALVYGFGHVGDGNLHMSVLPLTEEQIPAFKAAKPELMRRIDEATFALGGTLSAEHGVGRELRPRVEGQKPSIEWEMMRAIKKAFDPDDRLNPGVLLPDV